MSCHDMSPSCHLNVTDRSAIVVSTGSTERGSHVQLPGAGVGSDRDSTSHLSIPVTGSPQLANFSHLVCCLHAA